MPAGLKRFLLLETKNRCYCFLCDQKCSGLPLSYPSWFSSFSFALQGRATLTGTEALPSAPALLATHCTENIGLLMQAEDV